MVLMYKLYYILFIINDTWVHCAQECKHKSDIKINKMKIWRSYQAYNAIEHKNCVA